MLPVGENLYGSNIASVLNGYEDPRISIYYNPATLAEHTEEYLGVPEGVYAKDVTPIITKAILYQHPNNHSIHTRRSLTAAETWSYVPKHLYRVSIRKNERRKAML